MPWFTSVLRPCHPCDSSHSNQRESHGRQGRSTDEKNGTRQRNTTVEATLGNRRINLSSGVRVCPAHIFHGCHESSGFEPPSRADYKSAPRRHPQFQPQIGQLAIIVVRAVLGQRTLPQPNRVGPRAKRLARELTSQAFGLVG